MHNLTITIECDGDAFQSWMKGEEVAKILGECIYQVGYSDEDKKLYDSNWNPVGRLRWH
jgi:hypothetical protein